MTAYFADKYLSELQMSDVHNIEQRSRNMAAIKSANTVPEIYIRKLLTMEKFRYRLNRKELPGKPDLVLSKYKTVVFIHGCFWHMHMCHMGTIPKSNTEFWSSKLKLNLLRDQRNTKLLIALGWKVLVVWECSTKGKYKIPEDELRKKLSYLIKENDSIYKEITGIPR